MTNFPTTLHKHRRVKPHNRRPPSNSRSYEGRSTRRVRREEPICESSVSKREQLREDSIVYAAGLLAKVEAPSDELQGFIKKGDFSVKSFRLARQRLADALVNFGRRVKHDLIESLMAIAHEIRHAPRDLIKPCISAENTLNQILSANPGS
ncbi:MAG: hypothetical protein OXU45_08065 [Candidatus Melainabacteria bacterium]|nr:hypothetical protein [Candidatus Melainabacteria bacterium]